MGDAGVVGLQRRDEIEAGREGFGVDPGAQAHGADAFLLGQFPTGEVAGAGAAEGQLEGAFEA